MVQGGMPAMEAIQSATKVAAEALRIDDQYGTVAVGKFADLVAVRGNPADDITLLQNIAWIAWWTVLTRHHGFWNRLAHTIIAVPAVLAANTVRIVALALWASAQGPQVLASAGHLYIAWVTVAGHAMKVASENPIHALRYE